MIKYGYVIFDLDGTLMDTSSGIIRCIDAIAGQYHLVSPDETEKRAFIGPPIEKSFQAHYGCTRAYAMELAAAWRAAYQKKFLLDAVPYPGLYDLLRRMRQSGIKTAVATNKREDYTAILLKHFHIWPLMDCVIGSDSAGSRTKANMIELCMKQMGAADRRQCLMIGDTVGDQEAARATDVDFLGITYGFGFIKGKADCRTADSCEKIIEFLNLKDEGENDVSKAEKLSI